MGEEEYGLEMGGKEIYVWESMGEGGEEGGIKFFKFRVP